MCQNLSHRSLDLNLEWRSKCLIVCWNYFFSLDLTCTVIVCTILNGWPIKIHTCLNHFETCTHASTFVVGYTDHKFRTVVFSITVILIFHMFLHSFEQTLMSSRLPPRLPPRLPLRNSVVCFHLWRVYLSWLLLVQQCLMFVLNHTTVQCACGVVSMVLEKITFLISMNKEPGFFDVKWNTE